jgi:hypothetical protein
MLFKDGLQEIQQNKSTSQSKMLVRAPGFFPSNEINML